MIRIDSRCNFDFKISFLPPPQKKSIGETGPMLDSFGFPLFAAKYILKNVLLVSHETTCIYAPPDFFLDF